jgi:hypothetical protein
VTLPRPKGSASRLPSGRFGASAMTRRPRAPQAYSSLGRAVHHRQNFEARDIQVGQRSRRGLQQRLEHRTATSLLPLKCFKSFMYLGPFTCINKSLTVKGGSALPQQKPTLPRGLEGGTSSASKFSSEKFSTKTTFVPFDYVDNGILKTSERDLERQGRPSRGTPMPPGYGYLTHHLRRKVTRARISDSATEQVLTLETRGKKTQLYTLTLKMFRPQRPQETYTFLK